MGIDLSRLRRGNDHDRRPWHGGQLVQPEGPIDVLDKSVYDLTRIVEAQNQPGGTLYTAHIYVSCGGEATYQIDTARYVSNEGVQR